MDMHRGQLSRDSVASTSGRYVGHRSCPASLPARRYLPVPPVPRHNLGHHDVAAVLVPEIACRAARRTPQQSPSGVSTTATVTAPPSADAAAAAEAAAATELVQRERSPQEQPPQADLASDEELEGDDAAWRISADRVRRLNTLVELRRLYRNCFRAEFLLNLSSPLYTPPPPQPLLPAPPAELDEDDADPDQASSSVSSKGSLGSYSGSSNGLSNASMSSSSSSRGSTASEEDKALKGALDHVAEMALVLEQLKASLRSLPAGFGAAIFPPAAAAASEEAVREAARNHVGALRERLAAELPLLPISSDAAISYIESRNAKFSRRVALDELQGGAGGGPGAGGSSSGASGMGSSGGAGGAAAGGGAGSSSGGSPSDPGSSPRATPLERLEAAERVAGEIIANRIKPALKRASEQDFLQVVAGTGSYLKGLWVRLNGGSPAAVGRWGAVELAGWDLPRPEGTHEQSELAISRLSLDLEALEKRLQEASKKRENKLRKAGLQGRVQMAIQLKGLDAEVLHLSSLLAVRTLQLEMEHVYGSLEAEALDVVNGLQPGGLLARDGSTNELALLVAEFALLDEQLTLLAAALEGGQAPPGPQAGVAAAHGEEAVPAAAPSASSASAAAAAAMGPALINDEVLSKLALEIPDMRSRVGVADQVVFGGQGFSLTRARLQIRESLDKVREAVTFLTRGFKLLGSDVATGARLFVKAAMGNTLKPREVSALRRTARDLLTFIPFTIILIIPLSPLGHVLVFGFIQRYFPSFFPSQFSSRRQEIMVRYEELERQLLEAQAAVEAAEEEVELARAREAVARLVAPEPGLALVAAATEAGGSAVAVTTAPAGSAAVVAGAGGVAGVAPAVAVGGSGAAGVGAAPLATTGAAGAPLGAGAGSVVSSVDEVTLQEANQKVRFLAEQLDEIRDDVHMGDPLAEGEGKPAAGGSGEAAGGVVPRKAANGGGGGAVQGKKVHRH